MKTNKEIIIFYDSKIDLKKNEKNKEFFSFNFSVLNEIYRYINIKYNDYKIVLINLRRLNLTSFNLSNNFDNRNNTIMDLIKNNKHYFWIFPEHNRNFPAIFKLFIDIIKPNVWIDKTQFAVITTGGKFSFSRNIFINSFYSFGSLIIPGIFNCSKDINSNTFSLSTKQIKKIDNYFVWIHSLK